ncbi:F-box protein CPR1-like [Primulina huaijiensis]|uniref:F-box protein CPR1-like n=1 Tax=Primulina huaijiensis TaxID=1492673 RepID=UPI003CC73C24
MRDLPLEIIVDILCRLPVKSLKRFRAVSRWWCLQIDSQDFVKLHLRRSLVSNSNRNLILGGLALYSVDLDSLDKAHVIKPPFYYQSVDSISNSCNGLVVVTSEPPVLWNPFSRYYKILPQTAIGRPNSGDSYCKVTYGFGYDSVNDVYKVVRVEEVRNTITHVWMYSTAKIYSTKSNSWEMIEDFPYPLPFLRGNWRVHVNGALHTLIEKLEHLRSGEFVKIMAFNIETEEHFEVMMPQGVRFRGVHARLDVIGGCLCIVSSNSSGVVIWVMKEYGVKGSWTKLLSIRPPLIERDDFVKPLVYSSDGERILLNCDDKDLAWYNLKKKTVEIVSVDGLPFMFYAEVCVESLVGFDIPGQVKKLGTEKKKRNKSVNKRDDFLSEGFNLVL